jgi:hypothetical protein
MEAPIGDGEELGVGRASRPLPLGLRLRRWVERRAHERPLNRRGTARPQQGIEYLCARLIERGFVRPTPGWNPPYTPTTSDGGIGRPRPDELALLGRVKYVAALVRGRLGYPQELRSEA